MKINILLIWVILLASSCSSVSDSPVSREMLTSLLSTTFTVVGIVPAFPATCNIKGGGSSHTYPSQAVLDKIAYVQSRA